MRFLIFVICCILVVSSLHSKEIFLPFNEQNAKYWTYISDRTMGGVSDGQAYLDQDGEMYFARLLGNVSTKNNGGFIQIRSNLSFAKLNNLENDFKGIRLNARGNGETYHIFIRTSETKSYRDFFYATFIANENWQIVNLPFSDFKHRYSKKSLDGNDIRTFGIVAYGRDFFSDVSVSSIIFYD